LRKRSQERKKNGAGKDQVSHRKRMQFVNKVKV